MAPIINPQLCPTATDSWQAWESCNHFDKATTQDISSSTDLTQPVADRSEPRASNDNRTHDQTTSCGDQVSADELKNDISTGDGHVQCSDVITDSTEKEENGDLNARLTSNSDENSASTSTNANGDEQAHPTDDITKLPAKKSVHSEVQTVINTSSDDPVKDSYTGKVAGCPECEKMRQQKEKAFLSKNKSCAKFAWNRYLLRGFEGAVHPDWILHIVNGFVGQSGILSFECLYLSNENEQTAFYRTFWIF